MALQATNSDEGVRGAGLPACRRLSSRRAERKLGGAFSMERRFPTSSSRVRIRAPSTPPILGTVHWAEDHANWRRP